MNNKIKILKGEVISNKMNKTSVVIVERLIKHHLYGKYIKKSSKYYIHDENNLCKIGDYVHFMYYRPISKLKKWKLLNIINK